MKATDLDVDVGCPVCGGSGDDPLGTDAWDSNCPRCNGTGTINRYQDGPDDVVVLYEEYQVVNGMARFHQQTMPIRDEDTGGFEGRYGTWTPSDVTTGPMGDYQPDTVDQLTNDGLGSVGPYDLPTDDPYNGTTVEAADLPGGTWPADSDLTMNQIVAWNRSRGDEYTAQVYERIQSELGL